MTHKESADKIKLTVAQPDLALYRGQVTKRLIKTGSGLNIVVSTLASVDLMEVVKTSDCDHKKADGMWKKLPIVR